MKWWFFLGAIIALTILVTAKTVRNIRGKRRAGRSIHRVIERINRGTANPDAPIPRTRQEAGLPHSR